MTIKLVQNINIHSKKNKSHNYFKNVPNKKMWHSTIDYNNILSIIAKDNNIFELQSLLEDYDFACKHTNYICNVRIFN